MTPSSESQAESSVVCLASSYLDILRYYWGWCLFMTLRYSWWDLPCLPTFYIPSNDEFCGLVFALPKVGLGGESSYLMSSKTQILSTKFGFIFKFIYKSFTIYSYGRIRFTSLLMHMRFHLNINKIKDFIGSENKKMTSVFLWIPNIIGYFRFVFLFAVLFTYDCCPVTTIVLYAVSQLLDMFDGMAARHFNQCSNFGAVLDMVCDRASNAVMLAILGHLYPQYSWLFYGDIILDLVSHWYQMYSALSSGKHHKQIKNKFALLDIYYYNKLVLGGLVAGNEAFLLSSYLLAFSEQLQLSTGSYYFFFGLMVVSGLLFGVKKLMSVLQLIGSAMTIAERDAQTPQSDAKKSQ